MKKKLLTCFFSLFIATQLLAQTYTPSAENLKQREWFQNSKFGLFIHWGPFSIPGDGEWVMNNRGITVDSYSRLKDFFNPTEFDASHYVSLAKKAGIKYITLITRHHDGFSMWDTKYSDFNIMNTPYKKDIVKMFAEECHKQGISLYLYYSILDWRRTDYQYWTGKTGQKSGRTERGKWEDYIQFMKNQLTELLSNYGKIDGIWLDGHWDQTAPEGAKDRTSRADWHYDELYGLIHKLQPQCMIGNNHHMTPFAGEDFQMFEQDVPGENKSGLSFQEASKLPIESCITINNSWGFNLKDNQYKGQKDLIDYLVKSAGANSNLLLNIGPMPNGKIEAQCEERLTFMGDWLKTYGESIYNTRGGYLKQQPWGVITQGKGKMYIHILKNETGTIELPSFPYKKVIKAYGLKDNATYGFTLKQGTLSLTTKDSDELDQVVVLEVK